MNTKQLLALTTLTCVLFSCKKSGSGSSSADVYVAGFDNGSLVVWKNTKETVLSTTTAYYGNANGIAIDGSDVYVSGYVAGTAYYWKNGTQIQLSDGTSGNASAQAIAVSGGDVYVVGNQETTWVTRSYTGRTAWRMSCACPMNLSMETRLSCQTAMSMSADISVIQQCIGTMEQEQSWGNIRQL